MKRLLLLAACMAVLLPTAAHASRYRGGCNSIDCIVRVLHDNISPAEHRWLNAVAACETNGYSKAASYKVDKAFDGRYQFDPGSWAAVAPPWVMKRWDLAWKAPGRVQDIMALRWLRRAGWTAWPNCARGVPLPA